MGGIINRPTSGWESKLGVFSENNQNLRGVVDNLGLVQKKLFLVLDNSNVFMLMQEALFIK